VEFDREAEASSGVNGGWWLAGLIPVDSASQDLGWGLGKVVVGGIEAHRGVAG